MRPRLLAILLALTMAVTMGCGAVGSLLSGSNAGTVENLWPDVPPMPGMTKAKLDLPLPARLLIQGVFQGKLDFIAYTTASAPKDVQAFYSKERMASVGWNIDAGGCLGDTAAGSSAAQGAVCFFNRKEGGKDLGLAIFITVDDNTRQTQTFYTRIDLTSGTAQPGTPRPGSTPPASERKP